jgi:formylglycine-generating enzyme required for sulfatase activity
MRLAFVFVLLLIFQVAWSQAPGEMILIPEGELQTESGVIKMPGFYMDKYEVAVADFEKFVTATRYKTDAEKKGKSVCYGGDSIPNVTWRCNAQGQLRPKNEYNRPVIHVSYNDAVAYTHWAEKRLPTEDEWTYAASYRNNVNKTWLNRKRENLVAWNANNSNGDVSPVGTLMPNELGIYDLLGNTSEWTDPVRIYKQTKYVKSKGGFFCEEGLSPKSYLIQYLNSTSHMTGFRCVRNLK